MIITSNRYTNDNGRPAYSFFAKIEEADLSVLRISEPGQREYAVGKLMESTVGKTFEASYGYSLEICNMYGFDSKGFPVYYMRPRPPLVALTLDHGDPFRGIEPKLNPEYSKWEDVRAKIDYWCDTIARRFFSFANMAFFPEYASGDANKVFELDAETGHFSIKAGKAKKQEARKETEEVSEEPEDMPADVQEDTGEELVAHPEVPQTMPEIWKLLGHKDTSTYDFGIHTLSPAGKRPGLEGCWSAYRKNMLLTVARALLLRKHGVKVSSKDVSKSAIHAWKSNSRTRLYAEVLMEGNQEETKEHAKKILSEIDGFIDGNVKSQMKSMTKFYGEKWTLKAFVTYCKATGIVEFKKDGWRSKRGSKSV